MLICVDGTGLWDDVDYVVDMAGSFVGMIYFGSHMKNKRYYRGPDFSGTGPKLVSPMDVVSLISDYWRKGDHEIYMVGYSRGAAIVVHAANWLRFLPMPGGTFASVEALFLFDGVDRSIDLGADQVPSNVKYCYHAVRDEGAMSRVSFGNCALEASNPELTKMEVRKNFFTTHGGMGGVPWGKNGTDVNRELGSFVTFRASDATTRGIEIINRAKIERIRMAPHIYEGAPDWRFTNVTVAEEESGMNEVRKWMWPHLRQKHGVLT